MKPHSNEFLSTVLVDVILLYQKDIVQIASYQIQAFLSILNRRRRKTELISTARRSTRRSG